MKLPKLKIIPIKKSPKKEASKTSSVRKLPIPSFAGSTSIKSKIYACIISILVVYILLLSVLMFRSYQFSSRYASVLDNITMITSIKSESAKLGGSIENECLFPTDVASTGYDELTEAMVKDLESIDKNIDASYTLNRNYFEKFSTDTKRFIDDYALLRQICTEQFNMSGKDTAKKLSADASFIATSADSLLSFEIPRSNEIKNSIQKSFSLMLIIMVVCVLLTAAASVAVTIFLSKSITSPVKKLQKDLTQIADGDLTAPDLKIISRDEIGQTTSAFNKMKGNLSHIISEVKSSTIDLNEAVSTVNVSVEENAAGSNRISAAVDGMLDTLEQQKLEISHMTEQTTEMDNISRQVADDADKIQKSSNEAKHNAADGMSKINAYVAQMDEVNHSMEDMKNVFISFGQSTKEMSGILESIIEISSQTNLLSLNASIEAARAGEMGRGFSVVATEIRNLADSSASAASKIGDIIKQVDFEVASLNQRMNDCLLQVEKSNALTKETQDSFQIIQDGTGIVESNVKNIMRRLNLLTEKISATVSSMENLNTSSAENVNEINEISSIVSAEAANLSEVTNTMGQLLSLTSDLEALVSEFKLSEEA